MSNIPQPNEPSRILVSAREAAELLGVSERHWWNLNSRGSTPEPVRLGTSVRWRRDELQQWIAAGAPLRDRWLTMQSVN